MHILGLMGLNLIKLNRQQFVCEHCLLQLVFFFHQGSPVCVHFLHDRGHVGNVVLKGKGEIFLVYIDEYQRCKLWYLTLASQTSQTFLLIIYVIVTIWSHNNLGYIGQFFKAFELSWVNLADCFFKHGCHLCLEMVDLIKLFRPVILHQNNGESCFQSLNFF